MKPIILKCIGTLCLSFALPPSAGVAISYATGKVVTEQNPALDYRLQVRPPGEYHYTVTPDGDVTTGTYQVPDCKEHTEQLELEVERLREENKDLEVKILALKKMLHQCLSGCAKE